jgi:protein O-mannosyl-transferase
LIKMAKKAANPKQTAHTSPETSTQSGSDWRTWVPVLAAGLMFLITLTYPLLGLDDHQATVENKAVVEFSFFANFNLGMYAPLTWLAYSIPYQLLPKSAEWGYHVLCVVVHLVNTWLLARLLLRLGLSDSMRFLIALLFAIHPIQAESVAWVAGFSTPFYVLFCLLGLDFYLRYQTEENTQEQWKFYFLAIVMMVLGNLAKSAAVVLPLLLVITDWWLPSRLDLRKRVMGYAPFFLVALGFGLLTIYSRNVSGTTVGTDANGFSGLERLLLVCFAPVFYLSKILLPYKLNIYYSFDRVNGMLPIQYWLSPGIMAVLGYVCWYFRKTIPGLYIGLAFFMANILFTLPFVTLGTFELCADHYNYLACVGVFFAVGSVLTYFLKKKPQHTSTATAVLGAWFLFVTIQGFRQVGTWKDTITVVTNAIDNGYYHRGMMYFGRGVEYGDLNKPQLALADFTKAIEINPEMRDAYKFRSTLHANNGQIDLALKDIEKYLQYDPTDVVTWNNLAMIYMRQGKLQQSIEAFTKTIELKPTAAISYQNRSKVYEMMGDKVRAAEDLQRAKEVAQQNREEKGK